MATRLTDEFPSRTKSPTAAYPDGSYMNETAPGANDGTPLDERIGDDYEGLKQGLLNKAGITPNGQPDSVTNPQQLQAIEKFIGDGDSQLAGGSIWPLSSQDSAQVGDSGLDSVRYILSGDFLYLSDSELSGEITALDVNTRTITVSGVTSELRRKSVEFNNVNSLLESNSLQVGQKCTTGATVWEVIDDTLPLSLSKIKPLTSVYVDDFDLPVDADITTLILELLLYRVEVVMSRGGSYTLSLTAINDMHSGSSINMNGSTFKYIGHDTDPSKRMIQMDAAENIKIFDGIIDMQNSASTLVSGSVGIFAVTINNCTFERVEFRDFGASPAFGGPDGIGIFISSCEGVGSLAAFTVGDAFNNVVNECTFDAETGDFGVRFYSDFGLDQTHTFTQKTYNNIAMNCRIVDIGKSAMEFAGPVTEGCYAVNNYVVKSRIDGMDIDKGAKYCVFDGNTIESVDDGVSTNQFGGITVQSVVTGTAQYIATGNKVINNTILNSRRNAVQVNGGVDTIVEGNIIGQFGNNGIVISKDPSNTIDGARTFITNNHVGAGGTFEGGFITNSYTSISCNHPDCVIDSNVIDGRPFRCIDVPGDGTGLIISNNKFNYDFSSSNAEPTTRPIYIRALNVNVTGNTFTYEGPAQSDVDASIYFLNSGRAIVTGNLESSESGLQYTDFGVFANAGSEYINVASNTLLTSFQGVQLLSSNSSEFGNLHQTPPL